jgi:imidazolonepropionase-like amidohydrolase
MRPRARHRRWPALGPAALLLLAASPAIELRIAAAMKPPAQIGAGERALVISGVTLIDGTGAPPRPDTTIVVRGGRIAAVGAPARVAAPPGAERLDARGKFAIPALADTHVHIALRPNPGLTEEILAPLLVAFGVVTARDMGSDWERMTRLRKAVADGTIVGPSIVACGPFVDGPQPAAATVLPVDGDEAARRAVRELAARPVDFVKVQAGLSVASYRALADEARKLRIPFAGHVPEALSTLEVADAGQRTIEHLSPALPGDAGILLSYSSEEAALRAELAVMREAAERPGADRAALRARERAFQAKLLDTLDAAKSAAVRARLERSATWVVPTLVWSQTVRPLAADDLGGGVPLEYAPAALARRWQANRSRYARETPADELALNRRIAARALEEAGALYRAGVRLAAGTDAFDAFVLPGWSLHQELELLVRAGLPPIAALQTATRNAAELMGRLSERGTIEPGKLAEILILDADPLADIRNTRRISALVESGVLRRRPDLDAILARVAAAAAREVP